MQLAGELGLVGFLENVMDEGCEEVPWPLMSLVLVLGRLLDPRSELRLAEHIYEHTARAELLGVPGERVNDDRLYRTLDALLPHKDALQRHLKARLGELFDLQYDLLLYDVTSTYFEGLCEGNPQAQRGYSRDHRPDCKQVCIALIVSRCGMPLGYEVFAGNRTDVTTVREIVEKIESLYGQAQRVRPPSAFTRATCNSAPSGIRRKTASRPTSSSASWPTSSGRCWRCAAAAPAWATNPARCSTNWPASGPSTSSCIPTPACSCAAAASANPPTTRPSSCTAWA